MKKSLTIFLGILIIGGGAVLAYFFVHRQSIPPVAQKAHGPCLEEEEFAETSSTDSMFSVLVRQKKSQTIINKTQIPDVLVKHYHPIELHQCGVYAIREFNYNNKTNRSTPGYRNELWKYTYSSIDDKVLTFSQTDSAGKYTSFLNDDFRVDAAESYLSLIRGYLGAPDFAIVIKDLKTLADVFVFPITDVEKTNPDLVGDLGLEGGGWSADSRYFWATTYEGANTLAFIRIDTQDWHVDILPSPKDVLGGDALNLDRGLITVHPGNVWYGIAEVDEEEKAVRKTKGIGTELYVQNLITGTREFVASTTEPLHYFKPVWISSSELQYVMPEGETKTYRTTL